MEYRREAGIRAVEAAGVLVVLPLLVHFTLSWIGFNPTDDGFILAGARRILAGQVPHRDFISIRPAGSFLIHALEVRVGGDSVFMLSRLVFWFEIAVGAWCWVLLFEATRGHRFVPGIRGALAAFVFALNAHVFPAMAWHSVDAATLTAVGLAVAARNTGAWKLAGFAVLGLAPVCRQNFLPVVPLGVFLLGGWRSVGCWAAAAVPMAGYAGAIAALGGWPDLRLQLGARTDLVEPGFLAYARLRDTWVGLAAGAAAAWTVSRQWARGVPGIPAKAGAVVASAIAFAGAAALWRGSIHGASAFFLWGSAVGIAVVRSMTSPSGSVAAWLAAAAGWCVSVSFGYNTPVLLAGALAVVPLVLAVEALEDARPRAGLALALSLAVLALASLWHARRLHVYRDNPAATLTEELGGVLAGGRGIRTNPSTARLLASLGEAEARCGSRPYAVVPDCAAWWVRAPGVNPLPADWLSNTEISRPELFMRVVRALEAGRGSRLVILEKWRVASIAWERRPMRSLADYSIADYVRKAFRKTGETEYFEIFF